MDSLIINVEFEWMLVYPDLRISTFVPNTIAALCFNLLIECIIIIKVAFNVIGIV